jgi:alkylation response protein AidB-like acyl-CoA dehydrogenase
MEAVRTAQLLADELLFPAALATDAGDAVPVGLLDALAEAGLYGLAAPVDAGGLGADFPTTCAAVEALAGGCLTTAFVWAQHLGAVHAVAEGAPPELRATWLEPLARGGRRAGLALGGALPQPTLRARHDGDGWRLEGESPWLSGWGRIDVVHTAARDEDGGVLWLLVDAVEGAGLSVERLELAALNATATVRARFDALAVGGDRVTARHPYVEGPTPYEALRIHASFALGVAGRCCALLGPSPLDERLADVRARLDAADGETIAEPRAAAAELAWRAAAALAAARGSRSVLRSDHAQRLAREAYFLLVYALRPPVRSTLLGLLQG